MGALVGMPVYSFSGDNELPYLPRNDVNTDIAVESNNPFVQPTKGALSKSSKTEVDSVKQLETEMGT